MMIYLVNFDNGYDYSDNENYDVAVFDSYEKAEAFCLKQGYVESEIKGLFQKLYKEEYFSSYNRSLSINEVEMNSQFAKAGYDWDEV